MPDREFRKSVDTRIQIQDTNIFEPEQVQEIRTLEQSYPETGSQIPGLRLSIQIPDQDHLPSSVTPRSWAEPGYTGPTPKSMRSLSVEVCLASTFEYSNDLNFKHLVTGNISKEMPSPLPLDFKMGYI